MTGKRLRTYYNKLIHLNLRLVLKYFYKQGLTLNVNRTVNSKLRIKTKNVRTYL